MALPVLSDLEFNANDVAEAVAQYVGDQNTTLGTIITNLANNYAQLQTDIETALKADNTFIANIASQVTIGGTMKFVSLGKPAINTSGTEGTDYPDTGKTWLCMGLTTQYWNTSTMSIYGFGSPALMLSRNSDGDWLQDDGSYSSTVSTAWVVRDPNPDSSSSSHGSSFDQTFSANYGVADLTNNPDGTDTAPFSMPTYTVEMDTI